MADISRLNRLVNGVPTGVALDENTLVVDNLKIKDGNSDSVTFDLGTLTADRTITIPDSNVDLGDVADQAQDIADLVTLSGVAANEPDLGTFTGTTIPDDSTVKAALQSLETAHEEVDQNVNDLVSLSGVAENATTLGTFTGATIPDSSTIKAALQSLETAHEEVDQNVNDLITLSGVAENATTLGTFTGAIIPDSSSVKGALQALETSIETLPDPMEYVGNWAASTNTPTLADGIGDNGDVYYVSDDGTVDFGSGNIEFKQGDRVVYSGSLSVWQKWDTTDQVSSVNGLTGAVSLDTDDIAEGTALYFTDERAQDAVGAMVSNSSKVSLTYVDGTPSLTADIVSGSLVNADINASAAIAYSKLALSNSIVNADINSSAAIDASKIADGSVSSAEFQYLGGVTSDIQTQLNAKYDEVATTDDRLIRANGTDALQDSGVTLNDSNQMSGLALVSIGDLDISGSGLTNDTSSIAIQADVGGITLTTIDASSITLNPFGGGSVNLSDSASAYAGTFATNLHLQVSQTISFEPIDVNSTGTITALAATDASNVRLTGAGAKTIQGIVADNKILILQNTVAATLTIANENGSATAGNRIITGTGASLVIAEGGSVTLIYDSTASRWRVIAASGVVASAADASTIVEDNYVAGETLALGDIVILRAATIGGDLRWWKANSSASDNASASMGQGINKGDSDIIGVAQAAAASAGDAVSVIMQGEAVVNTTLTASGTFDKGSIVYLAITDGAVATVSPTTSESTVVRLGKAVLMGSAGTARIYIKAVFVAQN